MKSLNYNFNYDFAPVILWQYGEAEKLKGLIGKQQEFIDTAVRDYWRVINHDFLDIKTCNADGLSMWGQLLGVPRPSYKDNEQKTVDFTDSQYRLLLRARIYLLTFDGSAKSLNKFLHDTFPDLDIAVKDNYNMTVDINILQDLPEDISVLFSTQFANIFLPRPTGVEYNINKKVNWSEVFGFEGMTDETGQSITGFDQGSFYK